MSKKKKKDLDFNGGWSSGEAAHHIGKKMTEKVVKSKKEFKRKPKHKQKPGDEFHFLYWDETWD